MKKKVYYLIYVQYLGFRFHGWQKQKDVKTIHLMIDKTIRFVLGHDDFKTLGTSRTDAMVSASNSAFELFLNEHLEDEYQFLKCINKNFPSDIKATKILEVDEKFNIINTPKTKEYIYIFSFGEKAHPFSASLVSSFSNDSFDLELMKEGARVFVGEHDFYKYCTKPTEKTNTKREIIISEIIENTFFEASFFPIKTYVFRVKSSGFMRNQVRLMMGQLIELGRGKIDLEYLKKTLQGVDKTHFKYIAPSSGLILYKVSYDYNIKQNTQAKHQNVDK